MANVTYNHDTGHLEISDASDSFRVKMEQGEQIRIDRLDTRTNRWESAIGHRDFHRILSMVYKANVPK